MTEPPTYPPHVQWQPDPPPPPPVDIWADPTDAPPPPAPPCWPGCPVCADEDANADDE